MTYWYKTTIRAERVTMLSGKVSDDPFICDYRQDGECHTMLGKVPNNYWVPNDSLIREDRQGGACRAVSRYLTIVR